MFFKKIKKIFLDINEILYNSLSKNNKPETIVETIVDTKVETLDENINIPKIKQLKK
jgi:hypothetical protein